MNVAHDNLLILLYNLIQLFSKFYQGNNVPRPFTSFGSAGFPSEILKEVQDIVLFCFDPFFNPTGLAFSRTCKFPELFDPGCFLCK